MVEVDVQIYISTENVAMFEVALNNRICTIVTTGVDGGVLCYSEVTLTKKQATCKYYELINRRWLSNKAFELSGWAQ
jgi:hypothetical protein